MRSCSSVSAFHFFDSAYIYIILLGRVVQWLGLVAIMRVASRRRFCQCGAASLVRPAALITTRVDVRDIGKQSLSSSECVVQSRRSIFVLHRHSLVPMPFRRLVFSSAVFRLPICMVVLLCAPNTY